MLHIKILVVEKYVLTFFIKINLKMIFWNLLNC